MFWEFHVRVCTCFYLFYIYIVYFSINSSVFNHFYCFLTTFVVFDNFYCFAHYWSPPLALGTPPPPRPTLIFGRSMVVRVFVSSCLPPAHYFVDVFIARLVRRSCSSPKHVFFFSICFTHSSRRAFPPRGGRRQASNHARTLLYLGCTRYQRKR